MSERRSHIQMAPPPPPPKPNKSQTANGNGNGNGTGIGTGTGNGTLPNGNKNYNKIVAGQDQEPLAQNSSGVRRSQSPPRTEQVVMTPRGKTANSTVILIERKLVDEINDRVHVAGGDHTGHHHQQGHGRRAEERQQGGSALAGVPRLPGQRQYGQAFAGVAHPALLVPRLADQRGEAGPHRPGLLQGAGQSAGLSQSPGWVHHLLLRRLQPKVRGGADGAAEDRFRSQSNELTQKVQKETKIRKEKPYVYLYKSGEDVKTYFPVNDSLQQIAESLQANMQVKRPWEDYLNQAQQALAQKTDADFNRPDARTDKLFMNIGNNEVIEVAHPIAADEVDGVNRLRLHLGPIGSGRDLVRSDELRTQFARKYGLLATDVEMSSVLDSIIGNCRESFILVKGIADYKDGTSTRKWQNFAAISAASVVKSVICGMDAPTNV
ncbi:GM21702 [Drosophila sechellia]|uniref:GM21702 n=1 Tax=Drosophila sechellia TaxID=7238 RepID=B4IJY5_DROSE|nr:GM21702 [Drosophila sechellia]